MNKFFSKLVSVITAASVFVFVSLESLQSIYAANAAEASIIYGDVNNDNLVDVHDLTLIRREAINPNSTAINLKSADVNADGKIDKKDIIEIQEFILHKREIFSVNQADLADNILQSINKRDYSIVTPNEESETSLTAEMAKIIDEAESPVKVYEMLYNNIDTEFYFGSRKGAIGTFNQHGGNDIDQASLLIAAFRRLGYEADYISGLIQLSAQQAMAITGTDNEEVALNILKIQAPSDIKTIEADYDGQNKIKSIIIEHTWVKTKIPSKYVNNDNSENLVEIQLDTSFKEKHRLSVYDELNKIIGTDSKQTIDEAIDSGNSLEIYSAIDKAIEFNSGRSLNDLLPDDMKKTFSIIPVFNYEIVSNTIEGIEYLNGLRDQIQIKIDGGRAVVINSVDLYGKRLIIEYDFNDDDYQIFRETLLNVPETIFDIKQFHTQSGVKVQPYIKLDGQIIGTGGLVEIGAEQKMTISINTGGNISELKSTNMTAGSMYAICINTQNVDEENLYSSMQKISQDMKSLDFRSSYKDEVLGEYLSSIGNIYLAESNINKNFYSEQCNVHSERLLSVCVTAFNLEIVPNVINQLEVQEAGTIGLDIKSDAYNAISLKNLQSDVDKFYLSAGISGSYLEGEVLEALTGIESVSTMKILDLAREQNVDIVTISKKDPNYRSLLNSLENNGIPSYSFNEIMKKVEEGYDVITPIKNIEINSWTGIGYIIFNENEYNFMLSNGTNGGETTYAVTNLNGLLKNIVICLFVAALIVSIISFCSAGWTLGLMIAGEKAFEAGAVVSALWSTISVVSAADGLGDVIEGTATTGTKARVATTTLGKFIWKAIWTLVNG